MRKKNKEICLNTLYFMILTVGAMAVFLPFFWMLSTSLKTETEAIMMPVKWIPERFLWNNYVDAWSKASFARYMLNSAICSSFIILADVVTAILAGYSFAKFKFLGKEIIFFSFLWTMMFPLQIFLIPRYLLVSKFNWIDTYAGLIIPRMVHIESIFLLRQFFEGIPRDLEDAATIDGCSKIEILWKIVLPLSKPAISALIILRFMWSWGAFFWPLIVTNSERMRTLPLGLAVFKDEYTIHWSTLMAATVITIIPAITIFLIFQRNFVRGITLTGLKR